MLFSISAGAVHCLFLPVFSHFCPCLVIRALPWPLRSCSLFSSAQVARLQIFPWRPCTFSLNIFYFQVSSQLDHFFAISPPLRTALEERVARPTSVPSSVYFLQSPRRSIPSHHPSISCSSKAVHSPLSLLPRPSSVPFGRF